MDRHIDEVNSKLMPFDRDSTKGFERPWEAIPMGVPKGAAELFHHCLLEQFLT
jgi:hypothetical protein